MTVGGEVGGNITVKSDQAVLDASGATVDENIKAEGGGVTTVVQSGNGRLAQFVKGRCLFTVVD